MAQWLSKSQNKGPDQSFKQRQVNIQTKAKKIPKSIRKTPPARGQGHAVPKHFVVLDTPTTTRDENHHIPQSPEGKQNGNLYFHPKNAMETTTKSPEKCLESRIPTSEI